MLQLSKIFTGVTSRTNRRALVLSLLALGLVVFSPLASATPLAGTNALGIGVFANPGFVAPGTDPGTLLAFLNAPYSFSTTAGTTSGSLLSAVYRNSSGTLDFYYQVNNCLQAGLTCPGGVNSATSIARESDTSFAGFLTFVGFRIDGSSLAGTAFRTNGSDVMPQTADRSSGTGTTVGFNFNPADIQKIGPGMSSDVLIISTNAVNFTAGNADVIDGGTQTVASYQPTAAAPEPSSMALLGLGLLAIGGIGRKIKARR